MQRNENSRICDSEIEDNLKNNNFNKTIKRRRIVEDYLPPDDDDEVARHFSTNSLKGNELPERNSDKYVQQLRK